MSYYSSDDNRLRLLKEEKKRSLLPKSLVVHPIENSNENKLLIEYAASHLRGFQYRNIRQLNKELKELGANSNFIKNLTLSFVKFKLVDSIEHTRSYLLFLWKNYLPVSRQARYLELIDFAAESLRVQRKMKSAFNGLDDSDKRVMHYLIDTKPELWLPTTIFPLIDYEKEGKMSLAFEEFEPVKLSQFKRLAMKYLHKLSLKEMFVPPSDCLIKSGSTKYNDGGVVRRDSERPKLSADSMFLYQRFLTRPLVPREVWLPGKAVKLNNSFWMTICRQLLQKEVAYPDPDASVTWSKIKDRLKEVYQFDISGFGFQYPREYLQILADIICSLYPSDSITEQTEILKRILNNVNVQMPNGEFVYPPRGIGLGYYEDLKTLGILCILDPYGPISVYGDQGLLNPTNGQMAVNILRTYGFIIKEHKDYAKQSIVKWSGWSMSVDKLTKRSTFWDGIFGAFSGQEHWERKNSLRSFSETIDDYERIDKYIAYHYERTFGPEFSRGDSYNHFDNSGTTSSSPFKGGFRKEWRVDKLVTPNVSYESNIFHESPFLIEVNRKESKEFSKIRWKAYKYSSVESTEMVEYVYPRIKSNKKNNKYLTRLGAVLPWWADIKLVLEHGATSGTITSGLVGEQILKAVHNQRFAPDPFKSRATGGYEILTAWRTSRSESSEMHILGNILSELSLIHPYIVKRYDVKLGPADVWRPEFILYDYLVDQGALVPPKTMKRPAPLSSISRRDREDLRRKRIKHEEQFIRDGNFSLSSLSDILLNAVDIASTSDLNEVESSTGSTQEEAFLDDTLYEDIDLGEIANYLSANVEI